MSGLNYHAPTKQFTFTKVRKVRWEKALET